MKKYMMVTAICGCLLVGSLYPRLLLEHHVKLVDETGKELVIEGEYRDESPVKLEFGCFRFFRLADLSKGICTMIEKKGITYAKSKRSTDRGV